MREPIHPAWCTCRLCSGPRPIERSLTPYRSGAWRKAISRLLTAAAAMLTAIVLLFALTAFTA